VTNLKRAFHFYCQLVFYSEIREEFSIPMEFPDGSVKEVKLRIVPQEDSNRDASLNHGPSSASSRVLPLRRRPSE
jgi:hypothetical protein